jgi:hypothetical protein
MPDVLIKPNEGIYMMKKSVCLVTCALLASSAFAKVSERKLYVGSNSTEATLEFNGVVEYNTTSANPQERTLRNHIEAQLEHIVGPMSEAEYTAVPKGNHTVSNIKILKKVGNSLQVSYKYKGTAVVENGPTGTYPITMPVNPKTIYQKAMVGEENPCTDHHYQSEGDFWYFWSPDRAGCKLVKGKDYVIVDAKLTRVANTKLTYPEYQNLPDSKGIINIHVLFGMDEPEKDRNPLKSADTNAYNYRQIRTDFIKKGYVAKKWTDAEVAKVAKTLDGKAPYVETLTKGKIAIRFMFAPTGINEESLGFHWFYKDAIENSSIMIYSGHSGLGGHLDLESIEANLGEQIKFNTKKYQIFFFDSCTSYRYYNTQYLDRKITESDPNGTKKLDLFVNGLSTLFSAMPQSIDGLVGSVEKAVGMAAEGKAYVSYQSIAKQIDTENLFGIVGDEDNVSPIK